MATKTEADNRNLLVMNMQEFKNFASSMMKALPPEKCPTILAIGPTGCGKTDIINQIGTDLDLSVEVCHFAQIHPLDFGGVGLDNHSREMYFAKPPLHTRVMAHKAPRLFFADELDRTPPIAMSGLLQLMLERKQCGFEYKDTYIMAAANAWHAQYTFELDRAMASRLCIVHVKPEVDAWMGWAAQQGVDPRIIITVNQCPEVFNEHGLEREGHLKVADPRAWAALSTALKAGVSERFASAFVGEYAAKVFDRYVAFAQDYSKQIKAVLEGKTVKPSTLGAKTERENMQLLFGVYLAAGGQVRGGKQAVEVLTNAKEQLGGEQTWIVGKMVSYVVPIDEIHKAGGRELHMEVAAAALGA